MSSIQWHREHWLLFSHRCVLAISSCCRPMQMMQQRQWFGQQLLMSWMQRTLQVIKEVIQSDMMQWGHKVWHHLMACDSSSVLHVYSYNQNKTGPWSELSVHVLYSQMQMLYLLTESTFNTYFTRTILLRLMFGQVTFIRFKSVMVAPSYMIFCIILNFPS